MIDNATKKGSTAGSIGSGYVEPSVRRRRRRRMLALLAVAHLVGFSLSLDALMSTRTAPGAVAWIVSLNTLPYIAAPAYAVFGRSRFHGYVVARRDQDSELYHALGDHIADLQARRNPATHRSSHLRAIETLAKVPTLAGNSLDLLINGQETFDSIFEGLDSARGYILAQSYILRDDALGRAFQQRLIERSMEWMYIFCTTRSEVIGCRPATSKSLSLPG
jgi:cardiolipin synthase A/B